MKSALTFPAFLTYTFLAAAFIPLHAVGETAPTPDVLRHAIDPFNSVQQRGSFMRASGVDMELSQAEFEADRKAARGFVRVFDQWSDFARFDANSNGTIDFFEAEKCRFDQRKRVLAAYDTNKDGALTGTERETANKALSAGRIPAPVREATRRTTDAFPPEGQGAGGDAPADRGDRPANDMRERMREFIREHDKDGDGRLNEEERTAAREAMRKRFVEENDTDGDGELSDAERDAARRKMRERWEAERERRRQAFVEEHDKDGDGELSEEEREAARQAMRKRWEEQRTERRRQWLDRGGEEVMERYDTDKDGQLSDAEKDAAVKQMEERERERAEAMRRRMLEQYDKNKDGELDEEERAEARRQWRESRRRGSRRGGGDGDNDQRPRRRRNSDDNEQE